MDGRDEALQSAGPAGPAAGRRPEPGPDGAASEQPFAGPAAVADEVAAEAVAEVVAANRIRSWLSRPTPSALRSRAALWEAIRR